MKDLINCAPIQQEEVWREITTPIFPNIAYTCSFTFKGGYDTDMKICIGMDFKVNFVICIYISVLD